ncbi:MAG: cysteine--tRNA ligase [Pseudomonadota bacterium]
MSEFDLLRLVGRTPLVEVTRLNPNRRVRVLAKLESSNPGGSIKDRPALYMILRAEERGELTRDKVILEATSGNTGIGLALVAAVKGYRCMLAMAESVSAERRQILEALGAELLLTPAGLGTDGAIEKVYGLMREEPGRYYMPDQFNNPDNWRCHHEMTAPEIWEQTGGMLDVLVCAMGTTGTVMGLARRFRELSPGVLVIGVEPNVGHKIQGLKNMKESYKPGIFDKSLLGAKVNIEDEAAFETARALAKEGIFVGMSSGAAVYIALQKAREMDKGTIVAICPDGGERYLSTPLFKKTRPESALRFHNTLSRRKEGFSPITEGCVTMYSCGPTVHEVPHLGNCRRFVVADMIKRYLEHKGFKVRRVMNITDIDDKTIHGSEQAGQGLAEFTDRYIGEFLASIDALGVKRADVYPRASEHVDDMIQATRELVSRGYAYEKCNSVYFNISKFRGYGKLSRIDLDKINVGSTVDLDDYEKESPTDFTLLKRTTLAELKRGIFFKTEWGNVRPGWHIECACMARKHLGESFDIHTSGVDLIFPHHENEIAIAEALSGRRFANYWLHSELVYVDGKKMSRSAGSGLSLADLLAKGHTGREVRLFLLSTHYRKPLNFTLKGLYAAKESVRRLDDFCRRVVSRDPDTAADAGLEAVSEACGLAEERFTVAMDDDFNLSVALGALFGLVRALNPLLVAGKPLGGRALGLARGVLERLNSVLNVLDLSQPSLGAEASELIARRDEARRRGDYAAADQIREQLRSQGIELTDAPSGTMWRAAGPPPKLRYP